MRDAGVCFGRKLLRETGEEPALARQRRALNTVK